MMRRLLLVLALAGCKSSDGSMAPPPRAVQPLIQVSDDAHDFTHGNQFSRLQTLSVYVRVQVPAMPESTMLTLEFVDPEGLLFHEEHVPYTRLAEPTMMMDSTMHQPMLAWPAEKIDGGWAMVRGVPIRGTNFTRLPRGDGPWTVRVRIDGVAGELSTTAFFQP